MMKSFRYNYLKSNSIFIHERNSNELDNNSSSEGVFIKPSKLIFRNDITNCVLTAVNNDGKVSWENISLNKLHDVDLLGANDGDTIIYNKKENLWLPSRVNSIVGGKCVSVNENTIDLLFDDEKFMITSDNKLTLKTNPVVLSGSEGINVVTTLNQSGEIVADISIDNTVLKTSGDQIKTGSLGIDGLLNAEIISDGFITINSGDIANVTSVSFVDNDNDTDQITIMAPTSVQSGGYTLKLPPNQGLVNHFLVNDGMGNLSWKQSISSTTPGGSVGSIQFKDSSNTFSGSDNFIYDGTNTNLIGGQMFASAFNANSDINLKKEIEPISNCIELIDKIETYQYKWKLTSEKSFGVIAQQLEEIGLESVVKDNNGIKSVNYNELLSILIGAVKELIKKINN